MKVWPILLLTSMLWLLSGCVAPDGTVFRPQVAPDGSITGWQVDQPADKSVEQQAEQQAGEADMDAEAYYNRANEHFDQKEWVQAVEDYGKAIAGEPNRVEPYFFRALANAFQEEWDQAIEDLDQAIVLVPDLFEAYYYRGLIHMKQEEWDLVNEDFDHLLRLSPDDAQVLNFLCWNYTLQGQPESALPYCDQAIEVDPAPNIYDSRGFVHALLNDFDAAIADFQVAMEALQGVSDPAAVSRLEERKAWVEALQGGTNPITPEILAKELKELLKSAGF